VHYTTFVFLLKGGRVLLFNLFNAFRFGFAVVFLLLHIAVIAGLVAERRREKRSCRACQTDDASTPVTVIVPVHNEEATLGHLLDCLACQTYPASFIFVDDRSTDASASMLAGFAQAHKGRVQVLTLTENPGPNRKQFALTKAIESAGDAGGADGLLLFTDADCRVGADWVKGMVQRMRDERTGAALGAVFKTPEAGSLLNRYQCFDHAIRYMYLAGSTGLGAPGGGFGNNLAVRRSALDAVGGYGAVPPSPTEDAALVSLLRTKGWRIRAAWGWDIAAFTRNEKTWRALVNQTLRWNNGGLFSPEPGTRFNFSFLMITISLGMLALPLLPFLPALWPLPAAVLLSMSANTIATLALSGASLPRGRLWHPLLTVFTPLFFTFLTICGYLRVKITWKENGVNV
jgi:cellulose synthase/poly-beta-1,6-N-acetylglucosamine synthase-like glycosyltransferase